ncbi:hypothetical protein B0H66DRAFT_562623 [Apodospora peruviana]|uniref:Zn(2)-C6 fungal-type domain-containing protein n=1 Tax=Apodospora peruviana TaxID=516989 RepID=A0AAE0I1S3_9PEZI|nr:hypothetical protein B0H66DRAFT_562623 [Apodospora peruviana]
MTMPTSPSTDERREPRTAKLRSSCDGCLTAKVKCDRIHPDCSRCTMLKLDCVYGLSRKAGKPARRKRPHHDSDPTTSLKRICPASSSSREQHQTQNTDEQHHDLNLSFPDVLANESDMLPFPGSDNTALDINYLWWPEPLDEEPSAAEPPVRTAAASTTSDHNSTSSGGSHSCPRESYEIFRDLICPAPTLHAPNSNSATVSAQLDQVLHFNRNAIDRLGQVLNCPCAKSGHRATVHASIVSRILIWYQQTAGWTGSSSWGPQPPSQSATHSAAADSKPSLVQATGFSVEHVPVSVGTFNVEDQNIQAAFRVQLVLCELKKMAGLIDMFFTQDQDSGPEGVYGRGGVASLYAHLGTWLRNEHGRTVRILKVRLRAFNENLEEA